MKKVIISLLLVIIVLFAGYFLFLQKAKKSQVTEKITIAEFGEVFLYAPLYIAQDKGFFKEQGLEVNIVSTGGDEKTFAALLSGSAQFGVADPTFVAISGEKGQPGKVVAAVLNGVPFWGVAKNKNIPEITEPSQLNSYSVATFPAPSTAYILQKKMFQSGGLKVNIKETAFGSLLASMESGRVDIALELEPNVSAAVKRGDKVVYSLASYYPDFAITGLTALPSYIEKNPATVQKVANAFQKAMNYIRSNPSETADILIKRFPDVEKSVAESAVQNMIDANVFPKNITVNKAGWDAAIQLRKEVGDIKGDALYEDYVVTTFSAKAK